MSNHLGEALDLVNAASNSSDETSARSRHLRAAQLVLDELQPGPQRKELLEQLALGCYRQFEALNEWNMLEAALDYLAEVIEDTDDDDYANSARLAFLYSKFLQSRFMRGNNELDLQQAIELASQAVDRSREIDIAPTVLAERLENLRLCLFTKIHHDDTSTAEEFEEMMGIAKEAMALLTTTGTQNTTHILQAKSSLAISYLQKWKRDGDYDDLVYALRTGREAIELASANCESEMPAELFSNHAFCLQQAHLCFVQHHRVPPWMDPSNGETLLAEAVDCLAKSLSIGSERLLSGPEDILAFCFSIKKYPPSRRSQILGMCHESLKKGLGLFVKLCSISSREDQQNTLATLYGISRYAAAAMLQVGEDPYNALQLLERGRGVATLTQYGIPQLDPAIDGELTKSYQDAVESFRECFKSTFPYHERDQRMRRLKEIEEEIQTVSGVFPDLVLLERSEILSLANDKDVVVVNVTDIRSDAIIISRDAIRIVSLTNIDEDELSQASWEIQKRLAQENNQEEVFHDLQSMLSGLFRNLWKNLAKPILDELGYKERPVSDDSWPRVCWVPTGVLCLYPIHASGLCLHKAENVMNRVISSYATSLTTLLNASKRHKNCVLEAEKQPNKALIISMLETPKRQSLELAHHETNAITTVFPDAETLFNGNTQAVLAAVAKRPRFVHFSCHGEVDYSYPLQSKLLTVDWVDNPLTIAQLQTLNLESVQLAFLSACFTANAGVENLQDENVHIAGSLQLAGLANVVGSLWYVGEEAALDVVTRFYERLKRGGGDWSSDVACALHFAILDFRETTRTAANKMRGNCITWTPFLHFGP